MGLFDALFGKKTTSSALSQPVQQPAKQPKKILIVEDDATLANALELTFQHAGYTVFKAANGQEGINMTIANKPDLILLDLQMPVMDGKEMLRSLRETPDYKTLPVIVLTNAGDVDNIRETKTYYNASDFLVKANVTPDEIVKKASEYIGSA